MSDQNIKNLVILGGGTAGWMTASLMAKVLGKSINITLVESDKIGTVGVGEATIPPIINFNQALGLNEREFLKATKGTIKLGIQFENWLRQGESYMHAFGSIGKNFPFCDFHHFWRRSRASGQDSSLWDYSLNYQAAINNKFAHLAQIKGTNLPGISYAYHFDAGLYAQYLRSYSESKGIKRIEGTVKSVQVRPQDGFVETLILEDGQSIAGDLFVDCTGLAALLIEKTLGVDFEGWSHWLPCDRAMAVPSAGSKPIVPYTRSIAHAAGWQWRIPLQHRTGNGMVYSSKHWSDDEAREVLMGNLDGEALAEPRVIPFRTGRRTRQWDRNVVSIGLSSGFLEPLESTSIHLIQSAATRLIKSFPHQGIKAEEVAEFNRQSQVEIERIRDFIILHYKLNERRDSAFWRECESMSIPETLENKIELFRRTGKVFRDYDDLFTEVAWQQVMIGQGVFPEDHHTIADNLSEEQLSDLMNSLRTLVDGTVKSLPGHEQFLAGLS
ncbi:Flavin-dependent tryptophan halogenase RebH [Microbulbifer aggregans]|uniref:Flavin-dependent tryptophan halogenase RebH n=1 Tax=Microbulbifer aggregans TaxID=1769779 RepID=A0A1C9W402_9GAMM|nr:tryptophan halogenase family protein [Microbulbifer aggregans]AOS95889.1 Flavin-dependent tryptophan halogenase RebH [Microbulbifer aggregans]